MSRALTFIFLTVLIDSIGYGFPGAPFLCAALLTCGSLVLCLRAASSAVPVNVVSEGAR